MGPIALDSRGLDRLIGHLAAGGFEVLGPVLRDGIIALDRVTSAADLAAGVVDEQGPGRYRLAPDGDAPVLAHGPGPDSAKRFLFPPVEELATVRREGAHLRVDGPLAAPPRYAIVGLRSCDLHAVAVHDRVLLEGPFVDGGYAARRAAAFLVGVDCTRPAATCFCTSMGTGPRCTAGYDVALSAVAGGYLADAGTPAGEAVLTALSGRPATPAEEREAEARGEDAAAAISRRLDTTGLRDLLDGNPEHPRWADIAERCVSCGNCTAVCPTCFCHDVVDTVDLAGTTATRSRRWASCFDLEFSHLSAFDVRDSGRSRYRQWLTHKFAWWEDQFDVPGCVGCGRCITWCPVGIDVTEELAAIRAGDTRPGEAGA